VISGLDLERTLFILVSKSGTTLETLTNRDLVIQAMQNSGIEGLEPEKHIVGVTSKSSPLASSSSVLDAFFIDDYIGGRYSSTSAVGAVVLSLAYGFETFNALLSGAHEADIAALNPNIRENAALLDALLGVYLRNVLLYPSTAILPYSQALSRFPAHLQQLDMESNGKSVNRDGQPLDYPTGPVIFGEPGTNGQHSFYQLLHQGTDIVPLQFIGFVKSQYQKDVIVEGSSSQTKLNANLVAQIVAFATGKEDKNPNKQFLGERPCSLLLAEQLTPSVLGALLAHYENKVMFQGFIWNLNSFDQEGVQLGKVLATKVLNGCEGDDILRTYADLFSI
ncbi:MAG: glucose-6-phosphate isomerase, partial [Spirochaetia bacterium]|nr:glucose-6-phosphate isomerase [Spirochaetia bacterium]